MEVYLKNKYPGGEVHFETRIRGIPCGVRITGYIRGTPPSFDDPGDPEEVEFIVTDRKGYPADWLYRRASVEDRARVYALALEYCQNYEEQP